MTAGRPSFPPPAPPSLQRHSHPAAYNLTRPPSGQLTARCRSVCLIHSVGTHRVFALLIICSLLLAPFLLSAVWLRSEAAADLSSVFLSVLCLKSRVSSQGNTECLKAIFMWTLQKRDNYTSSQSATNVFMLYTEEILYFFTLCRFWKKYFKVFNLLNLKCHSAQIHPTTCDCVLFIKIIINLHFLTVLPPSSIVLSYLLEVIQNPSSQSVTEAYLTCFTASWIQYFAGTFFLNTRISLYTVGFWCCTPVCAFSWRHKARQRSCLQSFTSFYTSLCVNQAGESRTKRLSPKQSSLFLYCPSEESASPSTLLSGAYIKPNVYFFFTPQCWGDI